MLYPNNYKGKDKFAIGAFLRDIYSEELVMDSGIQTEIIWPDGPSLEFKNQFTGQLIEDCLFSLRKIYSEVLCNFLYWRYRRR